MPNTAQLVVGTSTANEQYSVTIPILIGAIVVIAFAFIIVTNKK